MVIVKKYQLGIDSVQEKIIIGSAEDGDIILIKEYRSLCGRVEVPTDGIVHDPRKRLIR